MKYVQRTGFAAIALCMVAPAAEAADISPVGTWRIKSFSQQILETNEIINPLGEDPVGGYIQYSPGGYMVVFLSVTNLRTPFPYTDAERAKIHKGIFGAYA